jgi:hypothetical protein|tara:strand:+ start:376 stop:558 length:183 start_codon:yes stop_codon:yes gene_type:complete
VSEHFLVLAPYSTQDSIIPDEIGGFGAELEESEDPPPPPQDTKEKMSRGNIFLRKAIKIV